jgi:hypothetical protein
MVHSEYIPLQVILCSYSDTCPFFNKTYIEYTPLETPDQVSPVRLVIRYGFVLLLSVFMPREGHLRLTVTTLAHHIYVTGGVCRCWLEQSRVAVHLILPDLSAFQLKRLSLLTKTGLLKNPFVARS